MLIEILKEDSCQRLIEEINKSGYTVNQLASYSHLGKQEVEKLINGDIKDMDFLMLVNICKTMNINPFSFFKEDLKLVDFINSIY